MKNIFLLTIGILFSTTLYAQSNLEKIKFQDARGLSWTRSIITEKASENRTLLLAVDEVQDNDQYLPRVVFRESYASLNREDLEAQKEVLRHPTERNVFSMEQLAPPEQRSNNPIWEVRNQWSVEEEKKYNQWVHDFVREDLFVGSDVKVDCADYAVALRWIYAHDHELPAANTMSGGGRLFGSWNGSSSWDRLPTHRDWKKDERFKSALRYLLSIIYTHAIITDLYPVQISPDMVTSGVVYLSLFRNSGHTRTILSVGPNGLACQPAGTSCITMIFGDEPAAEVGFVRQLVPYRVEKEAGGFLRFRWPVKNASGEWYLVPGTKMPAFSLEQYQWSQASYLAEFSKRMGLWPTVQERYLAVGRQAAEALLYRNIRVNAAYFVCSLIVCDPGSALYEEWSTPQSDHTFFSHIDNFQAVAAQMPAGSPEINQLQTELGYEMPIGSNRTAFQIISTNAKDFFSNDPRDDIETRWGLHSSLEQKFRSLSACLSMNTYWRVDLVTAALKLCYDGVSPQPKCSGENPKVKALSTSRLDQAFRIAFQKWKGLLQSSSPQLQSQIQLQFANTLAFYLINANGVGYEPVTMKSLYFDHPEFLNRMSSRPEDTQRTRWGL